MTRRSICMAPRKANVAITWTRVILATPPALDRDKAAFPGHIVIARHRPFATADHGVFDR